MQASVFRAGAARLILGRYLRDAVFGPGARNDWRTTVLGATQEGPNPAYFVGSFG